MWPTTSSLVLNATVGVVFLLAEAAPTYAQTGGLVTVSADADYRSRYLFAGIPFSTGSVTQGTVNIGVGGWTFHGYANYDLDLSQINEVDFWGDYYHQLTDHVGGFVGAAIYNFDFGMAWELTPELYAGLVFAVPGTPTVYYARDFDLTEGDHVYLSASHGISLADGNISLHGTGRVEYNNDYYRSGSSFGFADLNISLPIVVGRVTFTPMVVLFGALDDDFESRIIGRMNAHISVR